MALFRLLLFRSAPGRILNASRPLPPSALRSFFRKSLAQSRSYAVDSGKTTTPKSTITTTTKPQPTTGSNTPRIAEHLLIYHAGTGRITYLAFWKITTIFTCAFFCLVAAPAYMRSEDKSYLQAAGLAACGVIPFVYVAYTTAPFVTFIYLRLPPAARASRQHLERWVRAGPPASTQLELLTMGLATRPRSALTTVGELKPVSERMGIVNYARDVSRLSGMRKWHQYRPVAKFGVRGPSHKGVKEAWVWDAVKPLLGKTQGQRARST